MKRFFLLLFIFITIKSFGQSSANCYFDEQMNVVPKSIATIKGTGIVENGLFKVTAYYKKNHLAAIVNYSDSSLKQREGLSQYFYKSGKLNSQGIFQNGKREGLWFMKDEDGRTIDSSLYRDGKMTTEIRTFYYPDKSGKLVTFEDVPNDKLYTAEFNKYGGLVSFDSTHEDYRGLYFSTDTAAVFSSGPVGWLRFIQRTVMAHVDELNSEDNGTMMVRFVIDENGNLQDAIPLNKKNSNLAKIVIPALAHAGKWKPAIQDGQKVKTLYLQPVTIGGQP